MKYLNLFLEKNRKKKKRKKRRKNGMVFKKWNAKYGIENFIFYEISIKYKAMKIP